jgi:hypothetical protein
MRPCVTQWIRFQGPSCNLVPYVVSRMQTAQPKKADITTLQESTLVFCKVICILFVFCLAGLVGCQQVNPNACSKRPGEKEQETPTCTLLGEAFTIST